MLEMALLPGQCTHALRHTGSELSGRHLLYTYFLGELLWQLGCVLSTARRVVLRDGAAAAERAVQLQASAPFALLALSDVNGWDLQAPPQMPPAAATADTAAATAGAGAAADVAPAAAPLQVPPPPQMPAGVRQLQLGCLPLELGDGAGGALTTLSLEDEVSQRRFAKPAPLREASAASLSQRRFTKPAPLR